jgi:hypothetical protein
MSESINFFILRPALLERVLKSYHHLAHMREALFLLILSIGVLDCFSFQNAHMLMSITGRHISWNCECFFLVQIGPSCLAEKLKKENLEII